MYDLRMQEVAILAEAPRRERKKQLTRDALIQAALALFAAKGYENTAVHEITDAVDVSERTFFRYFASKEDLALSFVRAATDAMLASLAARPPEEEPLTALRNAFRESLRQVTADASQPGYLSVLELIDTTPALLAAHLRYAHDHSDAVVGVLARRESIDPVADPRPKILSTLFTGIVALSSHEWQTAGDSSVEAMLAVVDTYTDQLGPGLFGHWQ